MNSNTMRLKPASFLMTIATPPREGRGEAFHRTQS